MIRTFFEIITKPIWKWWVSMPFELIGILTFLKPDWGSTLNYPGLSEAVSWQTWVIFGLIVWAIGTAWEAAKEIYRLRESNNKSLPTSIIESNVDGGSMLFSAKEVNAPVTQQIIKREEIKLPPNIVVGFLGGNDQSFHSHVEFSVFQIIEPDFARLVNEKKDKLMEKWYLYSKGEFPGVNPGISAFLSLNRNYPTDVEKFLSEYEEYRINVHTLSVLDNRYRTVHPIIENRSKRPASNVIIELDIPKEIYPSKLVKDLMEWAIYLREDDREPEITPPIEPELFLSSDFFGYRLSPLDLSPVTNQHLMQDDELEVYIRGDKVTVVFRLENLVPNRPDLDFHPIPIWLGEINKPTAWRIPVRVYANELEEQPVVSYLEIKLSVEGNEAST